MRWSETTSWRSPKRCREACYTVLLHNTAKHVIEIISTNITLFTNVNYMCVCVCACMCVCVCVLARVRAHVCACTYVRTCMIIIVCVCVHGCSCVCGMHGCVCMCACVCVDGDRQRGRPDRRLPVRGGAPHGAHPEAGLLQTQRTGREARQQEAHQGGRREWGRQLDMHTSIYCTWASGPVYLELLFLSSSSWLSCHLIDQKRIVLRSLYTYSISIMWISHTLKEWPTLICDAIYSCSQDPPRIIGLHRRCLGTVDCHSQV